MSVCVCVVYVYVKVEYQKLIHFFLVFFLAKLDQCRLTDAIHPAGIVPVVVPGHRTTATVLLLLLLQDDDLRRRSSSAAAVVDHRRLRRVQRFGTDE